MTTWHTLAPGPHIAKRLLALAFSKMKLVHALPELPVNAKGNGLMLTVELAHC
jgi:hypothetical protein